MNMRREDIKTFDFDHLLQTMRVMQYFINLNLMSFYFCYMRFIFFRLNINGHAPLKSTCM